jgi:PBSX family phage terminase large subunit
MTTLNKLCLSAKISEQFHQVHKDIKQEKYSEYWLKGGRGSTKSSFAAIQIILGLINDKNSNALVIRKTANTLRGSVLQTLLFAIDLLEVSQYFDHIKSPAEITYLPTGQKIIMRGLDEPSKLKSIKVRQGYFKFLWFEEGEEYSGMEEIRSVKQSALRGGNKFVEFFTFNPPRNPYHWVNKELTTENEERLIHHSNYQQVSIEWLGEKFFKDAERLKKNNFEAYQHEYGGIPIGNPEEIIFSNCYEVAEFETPELNNMLNSRFFYGADWGFANDPTVLIRCFIMNDCLYIDQEAVGYHTQIDNIPKLFEEIEGSKSWLIYGDSSRPDTISYLSRQGFNIKAAIKKSTNTIKDGIEYIKSFKKIIVNPRCKRTILELQNYSYKVDKETKEILPLVDDKAGFDHCIDSIRYALSPYIAKKVSSLDIL